MKAYLSPNLRSRSESPLSRRADALCVVSFYRAASKIPIGKEKLSAASDTPRTHPSRENASRAWKKGKRTSTVGKPAAAIPASTAPPSGKLPMFAEEKPSLLPLPLEPFRYCQHGQRVVHLDGCVEVEAAYYGLPPGCIGRSVRVQWDELYVRILDPNNGLLLRDGSLVSASMPARWMGSHSVACSPRHSRSTRVAKVPQLRP